MKKVLVICAALAFAALAPPVLAVDHQMAISIEKQSQANGLPVITGAERLVATAYATPEQASHKGALMCPSPAAEADPQDNDKRTKPGGAKRAGAEAVPFTLRL